MNLESKMNQSVMGFLASIVGLAFVLIDMFTKKSLTIIGMVFFVICFIVLRAMIGKKSMTHIVRNTIIAIMWLLAGVIVTTVAGHFIWANSMDYIGSSFLVKMTDWILPVAFATTITASTIAYALVSVHYNLEISRTNYHYDDVYYDGDYDEYSD